MWRKSRKFEKERQNHMNPCIGVGSEEKALTAQSFAEQVDDMDHSASN